MATETDYGSLEQHGEAGAPEHIATLVHLRSSPLSPLQLAQQMEDADNDEEIERLRAAAERHEEPVYDVVSTFSDPRTRDFPFDADTVRGLVRGAQCAVHALCCARRPRANAAPPEGSRARVWHRPAHILRNEAPSCWYCRFL